VCLLSYPIPADVNFFLDELPYPGRGGPFSINMVVPSTLFPSSLSADRETCYSFYLLVFLRDYFR
jgi:hypothetical protein